MTGHGFSKIQPNYLHALTNSSRIFPRGTSQHTSEFIRCTYLQAAYCFFSLLRWVERSFGTIKIGPGMP